MYCWRSCRYVSSVASDRAYVRGVVAACGLGMGVTWNVTNVGAVAQPLAAHYAVSLGAIALLTSTMFFAELASTFPAGRLVDRFGPKLIGVACLALTAAANGGLLLATDFTVAMVLRFVLGVAVGGGFLAGTAYIDRVGGSALTQGIYSSVSMAGSGIGLALIPSLEEALGWRAPYLSAIAVCVVAALALGAGPATAGHVRRGGARLRALMTDSRILRYAVVQSAAFGLGIVISAWVVTILERRGDVSGEAAGLIGALIFLVGIAGRPIGGWCVKRRPDLSRSLFAAGMLCGAAGTTLLCVAAPPVAAVAGGVLVGIATGLPFGATMTALGRAFPQAFGSAFGAVNTYAIGTIVIGTPLVGLTFSLPGAGLIGFAVMAVLWALAALAVPDREALVGPLPVDGPQVASRR
jgi:MFS family permease